jgi:peptidoglycan/xylan/chitin deacetylase (PgdA/CDA1 family)
VSGILKEACLKAWKVSGLFGLASRSHYRNSRLLVLGFHGVSLYDEHRWDPSLYLSVENFHRRMEALKRARCAVVTLDEGLRLIKQGKLPERAVALTFDDGTYDFYKVVRPILKAFGYPATLYLTTYYAQLQYPSTPGIWSYMLWKAKGSRINAGDVLGTGVEFNIADEAGRTEALQRIISRADSQGMDGHQKNELSEKLARVLGLDFEALVSSRIIRLLKPEEVGKLAQDGVSVQMHMHRHCCPSAREAYLDNLQTNRNLISEMTGSEPTHFCYPSGDYTSESVSWLRGYGVASATTCDVGLMSAKTDPLLIPRLIVTSSLSDVAFESWLVGIGAIVSRSVRKLAGLARVTPTGKPLEDPQPRKSAPSSHSDLNDQMAKTRLGSEGPGRPETTDDAGISRRTGTDG